MASAAAAGGGAHGAGGERGTGGGRGEALPAEAGGVQGQRRRLRPAPALQRVARGNGGEGEGGQEMSHVGLAKGPDLVDDLTGLTIALELEVAIGHVVHGVQRVVGRVAVLRAGEVAHGGPGGGGGGP